MADNRLIFSVHAVKRMFNRRVTSHEVRKVIEEGHTIEEYPNDSPYPSRLIMGWNGERPLHVVVAENEQEDEVIVVTVYEPDLFNWLPGFERRRES